MSFDQDEEYGSEKEVLKIEEIAEDKGLQTDNEGGKNAVINEEDPDLPFYQPYKIRIFLSFFFIGLVNNVGQALILACTKQFGEKLGQPTLIALYPIALSLFNFFSRILNTKFCLKLKYKIRILLIGCYLICAYILMFTILKIGDRLNATLAFILSLIAAMMLGTGQSFGEANILGYLRNFPSQFLQAWSSGTGFAGVTGSSMTLIFKVNKIENMYLFLSMAPVVIIYYIVFFWTNIVMERIEKLKANIQPLDALVSKDDITYTDMVFGNKKKEDEIRSENQSISSKISMHTDVKQNKSLSWKNFKLGFSLGKKHYICLILVYFFQYSILTGYSERVSFFEYVEESDFKQHLYEIFQVCYQSGVFLSRSSLPIVKKIKFVQIFTILQGCNYIFWITEAIIGYVNISYALFALMLFVGLNAGSSYVDNIYYLLNNDYMEDIYKELCMGICTMFNDFGILSSQLTVLLFDSTFLKEKHDIL